MSEKTHQISNWDRLWHLPENREVNEGPSYRSKIRQLRHLLDSRTVKGKVLDVACGQGRLLKLWQTSAQELVGVDASEEALRRARHILPDARFTQLDIEQGQLPETFDWVFCTNALEEMANDEAALRNMAAMIKPGGYLALVVPHRKVYWTSKDEMAGNKRRYERDELIAKVEAAGLKIVETRIWGWPLHRIWYRLMEQVNQTKVWNEPTFSRWARLAGKMAYLALMFDDMFTNFRLGGILLLLAQKS